MGFFDTVGKVAGAAYNKLNEVSKEYQEAQERLERESDSELARIARGEASFFSSDSRFPVKAAACKILKDRGYTPEDIRHL